MECEVILQIFSGGFSGNAVHYDEVEKKLLSVLPILPVRKVIMGWAPDKAIYARTAEFLAKKNIDFFLWFPVFSETGAFRQLDPLVDLYGAPLENVRSQTAEDFSFCCPNNPQNIERILDIFESEFTSICFSGVFLDKIRYPSFAQGQQSVFSCFCPHCLKEYKTKKFEALHLKNVLSRPASSPLGITSYPGNGEYAFSENDVSRFFSLKAGFIFQSMRQICAFFRERGLKIGFDVFAPYLSPFVGQNLPVLSSLCDFIKPMMYRITHAPAGLPFEMEALLRQTGSVDSAKRQFFYDVLGFDPGKKDFDLDFAVKELSALSSSSACPVYAGVEINRKKDLAEVYPDYIEETILAYARTGIQGFVLSWDLLSMPAENLIRTGEVMKKINNNFL